MRTRHTEALLQQAKRDYDSGLTLEVVAAGMGTSYANLHYIFTRRGWPLRPKGEKVNGRLKYFDAEFLLPRIEAWNRLDSNAKGAVAEQQAEVWLASHGFDVWRPMFAHHCCDIGVLFDRTIVRCQVKTATYSSNGHLYEAHLKKMSGRYDHDRVDFFLIFCPGMPDPTFYVLPVTGDFPGDRLRLFPHRQHCQLKGKDWGAHRDAVHLLRTFNGGEQQEEKVPRRRAGQPGTRHAVGQLDH